MTQLRDSEGYTLVELMVTMVAAMILGGVVFSLYIATTRWIAPWQREITLENDGHLMARRLMADVTYAEQLVPSGDGSWTLTYPSGRSIQYQYRDDVLHRNGRRMHDAGLRVVGFELVPSRAGLLHAPPLQERPAGDARALDRVVMHLTVQGRERTLALTTVAALRRHRPWHPLPSE